MLTTLVLLGLNEGVSQHDLGEMISLRVHHLFPIGDFRMHLDPIKFNRRSGIESGIFQNPVAATKATLLCHVLET